ncbi:MAG: DUF1343 domain-containing protein [Oscillospiraceae bacterium]|nr:DUF1343 domain-containing protein [Oscillospiraceae bacterium]
MNKTQKTIIISLLILLILLTILNVFFIFSQLRPSNISDIRLNLINNHLNTTYNNYSNTKIDSNVAYAGTVELTDIYTPIKISFNYPLDEASLNSSNVILYTSDQKDVPIKLSLDESKNGFTITPVSGSFIDDSIYDLLIKKELSSSEGKQLLKDVRYTIEIKKLYLGTDLFLTDKYKSLFKNKNVGLITNQTGVDSLGESTLDKIYKSSNMSLGAIFTTEYGLNGDETSKDHVDSYIDEKYNTKVYNLGSTPKLTSDMLDGIDILIYDIQDLGIRCNSYLNTLYACMIGAKNSGIPIYVFDRPDPLGGEKIEGPVLEKAYESSIGVDSLPLSYGMTIGEISKYFNRNINCNLSVIPMIGWYRNMTYDDCNLDFIPLYPNIIDSNSIYLFGTTGISVGTNLNMADHYHGVTMKNVDLNALAKKMNGANLMGANFTVESYLNDESYIKINITNYEKFDPVLTGMYLIAYARIAFGDNFMIPVSSIYADKVIFEKIMGTNQISLMLSENKTPEEIIMSYQSQVDDFKKIREKYLIYK